MGTSKAFPERDRNFVKKVLSEIVDGGDIEKYSYFEHPILNKHNEPVMFGWYNSVLRDENGQIIATVSHGEDVAKLSGG